MKRIKIGTRMEIGMLSVGMYATNCYVVATPQGAFLVDPGANARAISAAIAQMGTQVSDIVFTHSHDDHMGAGYDMVARTGAETYAHPLDKKLIEDPWFEGRKLPIPGVRVDHTISDGDTLTLAGLQWKVLHTPGHTIGSICLYNEPEPGSQEPPVLLSGDTLFNAGIGRTDFEGGSVSQMTKSLKRLMKLPGNTVVLSGHGPATTIAAEKRNLGL
ncbi:MAG: MBL fold metallo-hydrolase [Eggerthellales bacterium]|nr:MBL fold metallo-hydrolase [Eggerthellales bacterium]